MLATDSPPEGRIGPKTELTARYVRLGAVGALLGPLLVLVANVYGLWVARTYGAGAEGIVDAAQTTPYLAFGGLRLLGGVLLVFGLLSLYLYQLEAAGRLGAVGFVLSLVGTILLTAVAWFQAFTVPVLAEEVPVFLEGLRAGEMGVLLGVGLQLPIFVQAIGWTVFGIATYRAGVFPRRAAAVLIVGALLLFVPVQGIPVVFQLAVAWLGFLLVTGRVEAPDREDAAARSPSDSVGE